MFLKKFKWWKYKALFNRKIAQYAGQEFVFNNWEEPIFDRIITKNEGWTYSVRVEIAKEKMPTVNDINELSPRICCKFENFPAESRALNVKANGQIFEKQQILALNEWFEHITKVSISFCFQVTGGGLVDASM